MGQKIKPTSLRLGLIENWRSRWWAKGNFKNQIEENIEDLSDEAKSDPKRLARAMERIYISLQKGDVVHSSKDSRRKIVDNFEITIPSGKTESKELENDDVKEAYRPFSKVFHITSEKERKELMQTIDEGEFVPMNMGNGYWFKHPSRGFERVEQKA